ncbi:hypothetical protein HOI18_04660 [Candidatus Uhrbacteria bacterium]|jgi:hypothetical protein|nr:hypothetical protein [Candidatus Uhrbacteria bacterium]
MKQFFPAPLPDHARNILRRMGYAEQRTRRGQISYTRRAGTNRFPRYHVYVEDRDGGMQVNLHVDQKEASYSGTSAHGGEYEGPLVTAEMQRIKNFVAVQSRPAATKPKKESKGFWGNLLG